MKFNDNRQKKILAYSALATSVLAGSSSALAQTFYHDFDPDTVLWEGPFMYLDLNFDGINDFKFNMDDLEVGAATQTNLLSIEPLAGNLVNYKMTYDTFIDEDCFSTTWYLAEKVVPKLNMGDTISNADQFTAEAAYMFRHQAYYSCEPEWHFGDWGGAGFIGGTTEDKYLGFKLFEDGEYYAGWMRLTTNVYWTEWGGDRNVIVKEYAYQTVPDVSIVAGDTFDLTSCETPTITGVVASPTGIKITWNAVDYASNYTLRYRVAGSSTWIKLDLGAVTKKRITGLLCNTTYEYSLRAICSADATILSSDYTDIQTQTTASCRVAEEAMTEQADIWTDGSNLFVHFDVQPEQPASLKIISMQGQIVYSSELINTENIIQVEIPAGMYLLAIMFNNERSVSKIIIE